jgi:integrase
MSRQHHSVRLQTRDARLKLPLRHDPYWYEVERGRSIGYHRGRRGGTWRLREFIEGAYRNRTLGRADDRNDADGTGILSFNDVIRLVLKSPDQSGEGLAGSGRIHLDVTVEDALKDYLDARKVRCSADDLKKDRICIEALIVPSPAGRRRGELSDEERRRFKYSLRGKLVGELTTEDLRRWRDSRVPHTDDREIRRRSQATANKLWSLLRAALNLAYQNEKTPSDQAWRRITPFKNVDRPQTRFLGVDECRRLVDAAEPYFRQLIRASLLTGMRLGELVRLTVGDVGPDYLTVHHSKSGASRRIPLKVEGVRLFRTAIDGKPHDARVLAQVNGAAWTPMRVSRALRQTCQEAKIAPPIQFRQLRTTYGSLLLNADASLNTISELLGHKDTRMTRRHYAHLLWDKLKETVDERLPKFD